MTIKKNVIWKIYLKSGKVYQCTELLLGKLKISLASLGLKNVDIRIRIKWGWS